MIYREKPRLCPQISLQNLSFLPLIYIRNNFVAEKELKICEKCKGISLSKFVVLYGS